MLYVRVSVSVRFGASVCELKGVSGKKKRRGTKKKANVHLKVLRSPAIEAADVHLDLPHSLLCVPPGASYHGYHTIVTFP